ncbi:lipopolysaccharide transport periplasmic protein LptA [Kordiimonas aestuarii]|uniref:lipopolysaccharide transport periplasmic protein LptA n=1 Tax=Kordiimonas aestuarii TaxID=1005925 RepID=UPI0021D32059|nr:lipopolysaccharide transport periplasmic protein LptA [Kordiimonas aestuarii]
MTIRTLVISGLLATTLWGISGVSAQSVLKNHDTYQPIDISAERLEMKQKEGRAIFKGAVVVKQGDMTLNANTLTVFYQAENGVENPSISRLDAEGNVKLSSASETLTGEWGVYDVDRRLITLGGDVTFQQGDSMLKGDRLEFDLVSGLAKLDGKASEDGRVRGQFSVPPKKDDKDGNK